jgi:hypothetical protein
LHFNIATSPTVGGVGEGRKAAAERWPLGRTINVSDNTSEHDTHSADTAAVREKPERWQQVVRRK